MCSFEDTRLMINSLFNKLTINLDKDIVEKVIKDFMSCYFVRQNDIIVDGDRGRKIIVATYDSEDGLLFELACILFRKVASEVELINRAKEEQKWRYVFCGPKKYSENKEYIYNTIFDSRKFMFEFNIRLLADLFPLKKINNIILDYTLKMNMWFVDEHWRFNYNSLSFEEISSSKEIDSQGVEHPQDSEIEK